MYKKLNSNHISAGEITQKYHITYQAVNHYTNLGLLDVVTKNGNVRMYDRGEVRRRLGKNRTVGGGRIFLALNSQKIDWIMNDDLIPPVPPAERFLKSLPLSQGGDLWPGRPACPAGRQEAFRGRDKK